MMLTGQRVLALWVQSGRDIKNHLVQGNFILSLQKEAQKAGLSTITQFFGEDWTMGVLYAF